VLIARHQAWIYNIVLRMVYNPYDAEDATQEILIKLLNSLSTFEGRSQFRTWLYRIVVNRRLIVVPHTGRDRRPERRTVPLAVE
jgi:RNA polymerase sigma factor (sigma-70 family)